MKVMRLLFDSRVGGDSVCLDLSIQSAELLQLIAILREGALELGVHFTQGLRSREGEDKDTS